MGKTRYGYTLEEADYWNLLSMLREYQTNKGDYGQTKCKKCKTCCNKGDRG